MAAILVFYLNVTAYQRISQYALHVAGLKILATRGRVDPAIPATCDTPSLLCVRGMLSMMTRAGGSGQRLLRM
jgi:hypothetical protein